MVGCISQEHKGPGFAEIITLSIFFDSFVTLIYSCLDPQPGLFIRLPFFVGFCNSSKARIT